MSIQASSTCQPSFGHAYATGSPWIHSRLHSAISDFWRSLSLLQLLPSLPRHCHCCCHCLHPLAAEPAVVIVAMQLLPWSSWSPSLLLCFGGLVVTIVVATFIVVMAVRWYMCCSRGCCFSISISSSSHWLLPAACCWLWWLWLRLWLWLWRQRWW